MADDDGSVAIARMPRPLITDPGLASLKTAARAGIVMPAVFAFANKVIGQPQTALFAAFGSFAMLVLASFSGPARSRLAAYLSLGLAAWCWSRWARSCSGNAWLAAGAMAVVGLRDPVLRHDQRLLRGGRDHRGHPGFVLSVAVPAPMLGDRRTGWPAGRWPRPSATWP